MVCLCPSHCPVYPRRFFATIEARTFSDIAFKVAEALLSDEIPADELRRLIEDAIDFDAPLVKLDEQVRVLELFHGPTLAFKDFGRRALWPG